MPEADLVTAGDGVKPAGIGSLLTVVDYVVVDAKWRIDIGYGVVSYCC